MSIDYYKCDICGETFCDAEFFEITKEDYHICENCLEEIGCNLDNQSEFVDEDGYLLEKFYEVKEQVTRAISLVKELV